MAAAFALSVIIATCTLGDVALATIGVVSCYFILNIAYCIRLKHFFWLCSLHFFIYVV